MSTAMSQTARPNTGTSFTSSHVNREGMPRAGPCRLFFGAHGEHRRSLERYVTGLLTDLPRKNCEHRPRCERVRVPESVTLASKPALAVLLLDRALAWGAPFATVVA